MSIIQRHSWWRLDSIKPYGVLVYTNMQWGRAKLCSNKLDFVLKT